MDISEERAILAGQKAISRDLLHTDLFERKEKCGPTGPVKLIRMVREPRRARLAAVHRERVKAAQAKLAQQRDQDMPGDHDEEVGEDNA